MNSDYYSVAGYRPVSQGKKAQKKKKPGRPTKAVDQPEDQQRCLHCTIPVDKCNGHCRPGESAKPITNGNWPEIQKRRAKKAVPAERED